MINIYPLETIGLVEKKVVNLPPASDDVKSMIDFVKLKPQADKRLQTLVHNIFAKVVMVKEYGKALQIAKEFKLTCITRDLQVVYAGAFITKVGTARN